MFYCWRKEFHREANDTQLFHSFKWQVQMFQAFVSAVWEVIHFQVAVFNQPIFREQISEIFRAFKQVPILKFKEEVRKNKSTTFLKNTK